MIRIRTIISAIVFVMMATSANAQWANGTWNAGTGTFAWVHLGADPYRGSNAHAIELIGIPAADRAGILNAMNQTPMRWNIPKGTRFANMVSGATGWVAQNVVAEWSSHSSASANVWYYTNPQGTQYRIVRVDECGNIIIEYMFGPPVIIECRCAPGVDAGPCIV